MLNTGFSGKLVTHQCCCCPNPEGFRGVHRGTLRALEFEKSQPCSYGYQGVHRGTLRALDDKQGPNPAPPGSPPYQLP